MVVKMIKIEVCIESYDDAKAAYEVGADRLEVSSCLEVGGLTPSIGLVRIVKDNLEIPVLPLIRERSGDFTYSKSEKMTMFKSIEGFMALGCSGFVIGALDRFGSIDVKFLKEIKREFSKSEIAFHRAFDFTLDPLREIKVLEEIGVNRILTSGQESDITKGTKLIGKLVQSSKSLSIMPGGGITPQNVKYIINKTGVKEIHTSASKEVIIDNKYLNKDLAMGEMNVRKRFSKERFLAIKEESENNA